MVRPINGTLNYNNLYVKNKSQKKEKVSTRQISATVPYYMPSFKANSDNYSGKLESIRDESVRKKIEFDNQNIRLKYLNNLEKIISGPLSDELLFLISRHNRGLSTEMPNCVMISGEDKKHNDDLIKYVKGNVECRVVEINATDDILETLENNKENYKNQKEWTVMHIKDFDKLLSLKTSDFETIEGFKSIMSDCAEEFHTTILFSTENIKDLDKIAIESHRVKTIDINSLSTKDSQRQAAKNRILSLMYDGAETIEARKDLLVALDLYDTFTEKYNINDMDTDIFMSLVNYHFANKVKEHLPLKLYRLNHELLKTNPDFSDRYVLFRNPFYDIAPDKFSPDEEFIGLEAYDSGSYRLPDFFTNSVGNYNYVSREKVLEGASQYYNNLKTYNNVDKDFMPYMFYFVDGYFGSRHNNSSFEKIKEVVESIPLDTKYTTEEIYEGLLDRKTVLSRDRNDKPLLISLNDNWRELLAKIDEFKGYYITTTYYPTQDYSRWEAAYKERTPKVISAIFHLFENFREISELVVIKDRLFNGAMIRSLKR